jgi:cyclophilin family peptidyl-prolyl cis-trans isomerase
MFNVKSKSFLYLFVLLGISLMSHGCQRKAFDEKWLEEKAPATYTIRFETTKGTFDVKVHTEWSPLAADRLYQMVSHRYFDYAIFYRVTEDFVAQFGSSNRMLMQQWMSYPVPDEPVLHANNRGTMTFARAGKDDRGSALFINLADNPKLDTIEQMGVRGFPPLGEVVSGMEVVDNLYHVYGDDLMQETHRMYSNRNGFMQMYPGLDYIKKAYLVSGE